MPILDSNLLIRLDDEDPVAIRTLKRLENSALIVPFQSAMEYACGTDDPKESLEAIAAAFHLERPEMETLEDATQRASRARARGQRIHGGDAWIAACAALRSDFVVTTNKRHFRRLEVPAWNYEKERGPPRKR